ncbi:MAG: hypothetical protein IPM92_02710 [Saprospiraceae bacterium]|nr:hypothetical protein [Saprospiraceae bacterium]
MAYYEYKLGNNAEYIIDTKLKTYILHLKSICLHVFSTGVLILSIDCENHKENQHDESSILLINEFGRRIYPQYLGNSEPRTAAVKSNFLASKIILNPDLGTNPIEDNFERFDDLTKLTTKGYYTTEGTTSYRDQMVIHAPKFISGLFNAHFAFNQHEHLDHKNGLIRLSRVMDDRMFFQCWYDNTKKANALAIPTKVDNTFMRIENEYLPAYATDKFWYSFMFGDKNQDDPSINDDNLQANQILTHTYSRWYDYKRKSGQYDGTLYGFTRDSFVCIGGCFVLPHIQTMYYQIAVLCLAQRSTALRYSGEVANLTPIKSKPQKMVRRIRSLHLHYVEFINKLYFREVTSQIQGIEMYNQLQDIMQIHKDVKDLDSEIQELHSYVTMYEQALIAKITTVGVPFAIVFGILGANIFQNGMVLGNTPDFNALKWIGCGLLISIITILILPFIFNSCIPIFRKLRKSL